MLHRTLKSKVKVTLPTVSVVRNEHHFSLYQLLAFGGAFAAIGAYFLISSFAATAAFGKTTIGTNCDTFAGDTKRVNRYSIGVTVAVSHLNLYLKHGTAHGSQPLKGVLYADNHGNPGSLIAATNQIKFSNTNAAGWYSLPFATPPTLNAGNYWIGILSGNTARVASYCYDKAHTNVRDLNSNIYTAGPNNPFGSFTPDNRAMSLNAAYTTASGGHPAAPAVSLTTNPTSITAGQSAMLLWSSSNASSCSAPWTSSKTTNGSQQVTPAATATYNITCNGAGGTASTSATLSVSTSGGGHPSPTVTLAAKPASITSGQSSVLSWTSMNAASCSAPWTASKATDGSQSVSPTATTSYSITCNGSGSSASTNTSVSVSTSGGGGGGACTTTLTGSQNTQLQSNTFHLQANEWASSAPFAICTDGGVDFKITTSGISQSGGAPGAYPSLYKGCHWGYCTTNSGMPVAVSRMAATAGVVTTSYNTTTISTGAWDDSYDIWFNANSTTSSNNSGLEMMVWLDHMGGVQPAGKVVASNVSIGGQTYNVWYGGPGTNGGTVSYVLTSPTSSVTNLDLGALAADSVKRGYMQNSWYLIDVEAGFEPWQGGQGLAANSFSVTVH